MSRGVPADRGRRLIGGGSVACPAVVAGALAMAVAACSTPRFGDCEVTCGQSGACPSGLECAEDGYCYRERGDPEAEDCVTRADAGDGADPDGDGLAIEPAEVVEVRPLAEPVDVRRIEPVAVTSCIIGGEEGSTVQYTESGEEVRPRDVVFPSYDEALAGELELPEDPSQLELDLTASFAVDPSGQVSSEDEIDVLSSTIPAEHYGVFYRQAIEVHHVGDLVAVTAASDEHTFGQVAVVDWRFVADLGIGEACPPFPPPPPSLDPSAELRSLAPRPRQQAGNL